MLYDGHTAFNYSSADCCSRIESLLALSPAEREASIRELDQNLASAIMNCLVARWAELSLCYIEAGQDPSCLDDIMLDIINSSDNAYEVLARADELLDSLKSTGLK